jgi:hypothetical protein
MNTRPPMSSTVSSLDVLEKEVARAEQRAVRRTLVGTLTPAVVAVVAMSAGWLSTHNAWEQVRSAEQQTKIAVERAQVAESLLQDGWINTTLTPQQVANSISGEWSYNGKRTSIKKESNRIVAINERNEQSSLVFAGPVHCSGARQIGITTYQLGLPPTSSRSHGVTVLSGQRERLC